MRKPNAIIHMAGYGLIYGVLLGMLYMWGFFILAGTAEFASIGAMLFTAFYALIFGGIPGAIMGFIEGWILWTMTRDIALPMTDDIFRTERNKSMAIIGGLTLLGMGAIMTVIFGLAFFDFFLTSVFILLPALIAGGAAAYATHRYFLRLRAWGSNSIEKAKNDASHKPKNNLAYAENDDENTLDMPETEAQMKSE